MEIPKIYILYGLNQNITGAEPGNFISPDEITFVKDLLDGKLYIGDGSNVMNEIKTDKSNNWAKTFFYGGD
jgi:hypothetical protein